MNNLLLITPPFTQLNTPYPATAYLKGFLKTKGIESYQMDLGIEVTLALFSKNGLENLFQKALENKSAASENAQRILALSQDYIHSIDSVVLFLQGKNASLARQVCSENYLPQASRFHQLEEMDWAFGSMGMQDKAKHLCTLYLEDLSDFIVERVDAHFGFSRYAERLGRSANSFDALYESLKQEVRFIDRFSLKILKAQLEKQQPNLVCFSVPFPGNLLSAFRCAQFIKQNYPNIKTAMGGGFPNTELRSLQDERVFDFFDYITLDDGELPIELLWEQINNPNEKPLFKRTFHLENGGVVYNNFSLRQDYKQADLGTPDYSDLLLDKYISVIEVANPMHSLWSDGRWNKLTMAHGCYWGKCTFCDISLDYIALYEPVAATLLVDRIEELIAQTGERGFHFVDEAAPPALMRAVALEILKRNLTVTWWTNIRFEKSFTQDLCYLLKASGCVAVSGGLEVASDRLLKLIDKGVTVEQVAQVTRNFTVAGVMVHSYLMYGYPTQTVQETIDSLEMVRQLFELGIVQSGFWHQFALTAHSPVGMDPDAYGITPHYNDITFANNDLEFTDATGIDHSKFSYGLKKSLFNYMHGLGFEMDLQEWFDFNIPATTIGLSYIEDCLQQQDFNTIKPNAKIVWIGSMPVVKTISKIKKGHPVAFTVMNFHTAVDAFEITLPSNQASWLLEQLARCTPANKPVTYNLLKISYESALAHFEPLWHSKALETLRENGLLVL